MNFSMHYVFILKTLVVSIYSVDLPTHCHTMLKNHSILSQCEVILSQKHVDLSI